MSFAYVTSKLLEGFGLTCLIFAITLVFALPLGLLVAFCSMGKHRAVRYASKAFVWIIRSTPLMLQVIIVFYGPGLIWGTGSYLPRLTAVIVAFIINYAAYFSEIYRGGIESISKGQYEAGQVLGMTKRQIFFRITLLQVVKRIIPPMSNEIITLVKDTSLARIIAVKELIMMAQEFISANALIWPLFYSGVFYMVFCGGLTLFFGAIEKKLDYFSA
ncbi:MAG: amino acid ABC transporter permease [Clostridiales Family XIII bacterium]|jgi:polar amino acid transport system permease protein|nr:amino acid ABC transporter permease [Clostridiales Family XIII bacterium]